MGPDMYLRDSNDNEVVYWRKANQIHAWFDNCLGGVENLEVYRITESMVKELLSTCRNVLANPDKAQELLPTQSGFFFGSTEYGEWYFDDITYTIEKFEQIMKTFNFKRNQLYYTAWW